VGQLAGKTYLQEKIVEAAMAERYRLYSHLNFTPEQWREAAGRYLKLDDALAQLERDDNKSITMPSRKTSSAASDASKSSNWRGTARSLPCASARSGLGSWWNPRRRR
jgi:hypothetical protein